MTTQQLIEALQKVSPDKEVYYKDQDPFLGISFTIIRRIIRVPNSYNIQCECGEILVQRLSAEIGILDCSCGCSYSVELHKKKES